ncbi:hypothetical protein [Clavibacter nebraskensis]|uniref:hypothetical protein n=1 Tax=Clavibacter nebraskensis TaxID=31963 RepID=UPI003DA76059
MSSETHHLLRPEEWDAHPSWDDGWQMAPDAATLRGVLWCRRGLTGAQHRAVNAGSVAFDHWAAAVEAVWWAVALDEALHSLHDERYRIARASHADGKTVVSLRWLRHQHAHRIVVTGHGGPKRNFFGPTGFGPPFYISPSNRWMQRSDIPADGRRQDHVAEAAYDARVAGYPLDDPIGEALKWFDTVLTAAGIDPHQDADGEDPTVL